MNILSFSEDSDGKKSCSQNSIFSRIISRVDTSTPLDPLRDEYLCMTPDDTTYNCRAVLLF